MLERLAGNDALKAELGTALRGGRLPHAVLLVGEPGCGAGFAARCLAADYLYPAGGPHAEAVLKKEDTECLVLQGEGASGQIPVKKGARGAGGDPALGAVHRRGGPRAVHLRRAESERVIRQRDAEDHRGAARGGAVPADGDERGHRAADDPQPVRGLHDCAGARGRLCRPLKGRASARQGGGGAGVFV